MSPLKTRLNKRLVQLGLAPSRRKADELISDGRVSINNKTCSELGITVTDNDNVRLDGRLGSTKTDIYIAYYKPVGEVCSHSDETGARTVFDSLPKAFGQLKIAGRLDMDSEGLLILSSDGSFIQTLSHPSNSKEKEYVVTTAVALSKKAQDDLLAGVKLRDGLSKVHKLRAMPAKRVALVLTEGRKRQIRRMFKTVGYPVVKLERIRIGKYRNDQLRPRAYTFIKPEEVL